MRLSICIPTYNRARMLETTIGTILDQTYSDFELVIVDNDSKDNTAAVVGSIRDPRIRYIRNPKNVGHVENHNRCLEEARGDVIAIYHDHDLYDRDLVRRSVELLAANPQVGMVCCAVHLVDPTCPERIIRTFAEDWPPVVSGLELRNRLLHRWPSPIPAPTAMVRRACYEQCGGFRPEFGLAADRELWIRILRCWDLGYIAEPLARLRDGEKPEGFDHVRALNIWKTIENHARIQRTHLEGEFAGAKLRLWFERRRLHAKVFAEMWRQAVWSLAKGHEEVIRTGIPAFADAGLNGSAGVLKWLARHGRVAGAAASRFLELYKGVARRDEAAWNQAIHGKTENPLHRA